jgi:Domain of unknown function (DUF397)
MAGGPFWPGWRGLAQEHLQCPQRLREVAFIDGLVAVRDAKDPQGCALLSSTEWRAFVDRVRHGQLDLP